MANEIIPPNTPFTRAVERVRATRATQGTSAAEEMELPRTSPRARLNYFPDDSTLGSMVDRALAALSRGIVWARGAIVNLVV